MNTTLNDLARDQVGTEGSLFFVTLLDQMEFDGAPTTIAAFADESDARKFYMLMLMDATRSQCDLLLEGPSGIIETTQTEGVEE
jgi:hypothetical protein